MVRTPAVLDRVAPLDRTLAPTAADSHGWHPLCTVLRQKNQEADMEERTTERKTTIKDTTVPKGQTTNVNVRPGGGADVQVNDPNVGDEVVEETTTTTRRTP
jgi:hypothetical protein